MNMTISHKTSILLATLEDQPIPKTTVAFFCRNNQNRYHSLILRLFKQSGLTQKTLANRLGKDTARINRLLSSASNLTINTITTLLLAMGVDLDDPSGAFITQLVGRTELDADSTPALGLQSTNNVRSIVDALTKKRLEQSPVPPPNVETLNSNQPLLSRIISGGTGR